MRVGIVIATPGLAFRAFLNARKDGVLPAATVRKEFGTRGVTFRCCRSRSTPRSRPTTSAAGSIAHLPVRRFHRLDRHGLRPCGDAMRDAFFVIAFASHYPGTNHLNRVGAVLAPTLAKRLDDASHRHALVGAVITQVRIRE